jgi:hypothetical protein
MSKQLSPSVVGLIGESNLTEVSHANVSVTISGTPSEVQRATKHLAKSKGAFKKAIEKSHVAEPEHEEPEADDGDVEESSPRDFANLLLDGETE